MIMVVTTAVRDADGNATFPGFERAYGHIRLWVRGTPPRPTELYILVGGFVPTGRQRMNTADYAEIKAEIERIFVKVSARSSDYGPRTGRSFNMDIQVSEAFINRYR